MQAARLCSVRQARLQLGIVLGFAVLYNLPKLAEARVELDIVSVADETGNSSSSSPSSPDASADWTSSTGGPLPTSVIGLIPAYTWIGENELYRVVYGNVMYTVFMLALPLLALTVLNVRLIWTLKAIGRKRAELQRGGARPNCRQQQAQDNNVTLVLIIVVLVFTVCQVNLHSYQCFCRSSCDRLVRIMQRMRIPSDAIQSVLPLGNGNVENSRYA
jgi:hypothetical protein